ncbi:hypothetical Protein YC6258_01398 [Gynuella sunshinyii YC6258]|uniref:Uncharacterized protein n=1 Tax=Gynuella sunshinyii YC6258 TaxID=1445510 RepID=A0A0C5VGU8_9GAMM|nr:hypothetical Protein YC6258_01398 [Gynuella sunshinyii YC6258]
MARQIMADLEIEQKPAHGDGDSREQDVKTDIRSKLNARQYESIHNSSVTILKKTYAPYLGPAAI